MALAKSLNWDWAASEAEFQKAAGLSPNDPNVHYFCAFSVLVPQKRLPEALREYRRALDLDPLSQIMNTNYAVALMINRQDDLAETQFKRTQEIDSNFAVLNLRMGEFHAFHRNFEQAKMEFDKASQFVGKIVWQPGRDGFYRALLASSVEVAGSAGESFAAAALGDKERAIHSLEQMAADDPQDAAIYVRRPEFDSLYAEPRFQALLRRMNFQP